MSSPQRAFGPARIALAGLLLIVLVGNLASIAMKSAPRGPDELDVFSGTLIYITQGYGAAGLFTAQPHDFINFPPLLPWLGWLTTSIFGPSYLSLALIPTLFQLALLLALFDVGRRFGGEWCGLLAACVLATTPAIMAYSRVLITNIPAVALEGLVLWALLRSERFQKWNYSLLAGLFTGLACLVERGTPPLLLSLPLLYWAVVSLRSARAQGGSRLKTLARMGAAAALALALSGVYLWSYFNRRLDHIANLGANDAYPQVHRILDWLPEPLFYPAAMLTHQLSLIWILPLLIALPLFVRRLDAERGLIGLAALWPMVAMAPFATKTFNYDLGKFPAVALVIAVGLCSIERTTLRRAAVGLGLGAAALSLWVLQPQLLPHPPRPAPVRAWLSELNNFDLLGHDTPVLHDAVQRRLQKRLPVGPQYAFVINAPQSEQVFALFCEIGNFGWLHYPQSDQMLRIDRARPEGAELLIDVWDLDPQQRDELRQVYKRRSCPYIIEQDLPLPDRASNCQPLYADVIDGQEVQWSLCRTP
ncbi:MAG: glycosyltransferase family 39 protein [Candidatus Alcyoniella australis]|nr:glycosyltransferase family 39 protein [Candidatus Alcyoniella australis]